ncbi:MAG: prepilin-type N-terminal cleavage/methylation domain-containing protein [Opitutaceae bacterium]|nr:prepilin-type N-terminal cleavage/methylation domain-containing protein [Opitutaceae bacterium]
MRRSRQGFTIIEVLVALAILALAAIVLGSSYANVINSYFVMKKSVRAEADFGFARSMLLAEPDLKKVEEGADFATMDGHRVRWSATVEPTTIADLFSVTFHCEVAGSTLEETRTTDQVFRLLRPTWSEAGERDKLRAESQKRILEMQVKRQ